MKTNKQKYSENVKHVHLLTKTNPAQPNAVQAIHIMRLYSTEGSSALCVDQCFCVH